MKIEKLIGIAAIGGILWMMFNQQPNKRQALINLARNTSGDKAAIEAIFRQMTNAEVGITYEYIFNWVNKGRKLEQGSPLWQQVQAIGTKYNIFT